MTDWLSAARDRFVTSAEPGVGTGADTGPVLSEVANNGARSTAALDFPATNQAQHQQLVRSLSTSVRGGRWIQIVYVLFDIFFVSLDAAAVFLFRFGPASLVGGIRLGSSTVLRSLPLNEYLAITLLYCSLIVLCCQSQGLYWTPRSRTTLDESIAVSKAVLLATLLLTAFIYLSGAKEISRLWVGYSSILSVVTLVFWRVWKRHIVIWRVTQGVGAQNILIVGGGKVGQALARHLQQNKQLGYLVKGFLDQNHTGDHRILGRIEDLAQVARAQFVDGVFITIPSQRELVKNVAIEARGLRLDVKVIPELYDGLGWNAPVRYVGNFPVMELHWEPIPTVGLLLKRMIDIVSSAFVLLALLPLLTVIAIAIKFDSPGPVLYRSKRMGKKGRVFVCHKFRTMVANADGLKDQLRHLNERDGPFFKIAEDPRVTRLGKVLRKYSLDELPQVWNVLKGDMSLVGPRPHPLDDYHQYSLEHLRRLDVKPGITGLWQVTARQHPSFERNVMLDLEYIENWDLWLDIKIMLQTIPAIVRGEGV
jgi:exopolysaccharide biosynthesis polyprenyl glycosylphosphotransferase